jgi:hypothetical protein
MVGLRINLDGEGHVLQASKPQPVVLTLFSRRPSRSLSWEVVDGEGMVDRKPDTKASHGIGGGIRKSQKAGESST